MTSIEWLDEQLQEYVIAADHVANTMVIQISFEEYMDLKRQAKEMHKREIIDAQSYAISHADMTNNRGYFDCEKYYQETFKKNKS